MSNRVSMPRWPAWAMLAICGAFAYPAMTAPVPDDPGLEHYEARGNEPGWNLVIDHRSIAYFGPGGASKIAVERPDPRPSPYGRRYATNRLTIDLVYRSCNDDLTGHGYEHQVLVTADGKTSRGCGGARRQDWDV
ncbi:hypothetical protein [Sphingosinicella sp. BN140058]|uniref:hypothetical protein n=1 Tax=Sphingosinicella sp. BN140058 TaxID=1892855 RepID=UPI00101149D3|nr:hypothetical protein [Sphingosinicella sp. BN140058]QAY79171.1 hypothetical protein ETR14_23515 [Sphingosinicella sp. BN140058]